MREGLDSLFFFSVFTALVPTPLNVAFGGLYP